MKRILGELLLPGLAVLMLSIALLHVVRASQTVADAPPTVTIRWRRRRHRRRRRTIRDEGPPVPRPRRRDS